MVSTIKNSTFQRGTHLLKLTTVPHRQQAKRSQNRLKSPAVRFHLRLDVIILIKKNRKKNTQKEQIPQKNLPI